jgi:hypothetical protein
MPLAGTKRIAPEELKNSIDARELVAKFRSKKDLYDYLSFQSKMIRFFAFLFIGQYYMPSRKKVTKDFLKLVFAGKKDLIPQA